MSELKIDLKNLSVTIFDCASGDPHVALEAEGETLRIDAHVVRRLADVLIGASVMMTPDPEPDVVEGFWRGTGRYPSEPEPVAD